VDSKYVSSHPDLLKNLNHGDKVYIIEINNFNRFCDKLIGYTKDAMDNYYSVLKDISMVEKEEDFIKIRKKSENILKKLDGKKNKNY